MSRVEGTPGSVTPLRGHGVLIAAIGFFAIAAQTILFRGFFSVFEGHELGIGVFFASWLLWNGLGALAGRRIASRVPLGGMAFLYPFVFVLQHALIAHARTYAGVAAFEQFPMVRLFAAAFAVNAPFSILTGILFVVASRTIEHDTLLPPGRVYAIETLGGCVGGMLVTLALVYGMREESFALCATAMLLGASAWSLAGVRRYGIGVLALACAVAALQGTLPARWAGANARIEWSRLLPVEGYRGAFVTAQGHYTYGQRGGQFILLHNGAACESWPADAHAAEVAAIHLAEKPDMRRVLVAGTDALGLCDRLHAAASVEHVTWVHPDPAYAREARAVLEANGAGSAMPGDMPAVDLRAYADHAPCHFDAVILNLPLISTLAMNRYVSLEGLQSLRRLLEPGGMVSVRIQGGENFLGTERVFLGASVLATLQAVFKHVVMKPGEETWFFASDTDDLSVFPATLRRQFEGVPGSEALYPSANIPALFPPDRIVFQQEAYDKAVHALGADALRIGDTHPRALLFALLLALKQAEWPLPESLLPMAARDAMPLLVMPLLIFFIWRIVYRRRGTVRLQRRFDTFDVLFLAASTGAMGMAANMQLMFAYQMRFGTLYLHAGLLAAAFMAGAFVVARIIEWRLNAGTRWGVLFAVIAAMHTAFLLVLAWETEWGPSAMALMVFGAGAMTGAYFPLVVSALAGMLEDMPRVAACAQAADTAGGALAALFVPVLLIPTIGASRLVAVLLALLVLNVLPCVVRGGRSPVLGRRMRMWGYLLAGCAVYALFVSGFVASHRDGSDETRFWDAVHALAGAETFSREQGRCADGAAFPYATLEDGSLVFPTQPWAADIKGYGGGIFLAVHIEANGVLRDYAVVRSKETRSYLAMVEARKDGLKGRNLFAANPFGDTVLVSGASVSDFAIRHVLARAGQGFAADVLGQVPAAGSAKTRAIPSHARRDAGVLSALLLTGYMLRYWPRRWARRILLAISAFLLGFVLNLQYSVQHVFLLLDGGVFDLAVGSVLWLVIVLPVAAALCGNVYCGYLCPAGAIQDLAGACWPRRWRVAPHARVWRLTRPLKYLLLFGMVIGFACVRDYRVAQADPLVVLFAGGWERSFTVFVACMMVASLFMPRFWCRALCPAGAFLSLFNGVRWLARLSPARHPAHCDIGIRSVYELDCLYCDRCSANHREAAQQPTPGVRRLADGLLACAACIAFLFVATHGLQAVRAITPVSTAVVTASGVTGTPRDVDMGALREGLNSGGLSNHPAAFQHSTGEP